MGRFYNINLKEMDAFLSGQGFRPVTIPGTVELVYAKIIYKCDKRHRLSLRLLTGINPSGESRAKGEDAIRIQLYYMYNDVAKPVGRPQRCLRVHNWRVNISKALEKVQADENYVVCSKCGHPKVIRDGTKGEFWGCVTWHDTKCDGKDLK